MRPLGLYALIPCIALGACGSGPNRLAGLYSTAKCRIGDLPATDCSAEPLAVASLVTIPTQPASPDPTGTTLPERALAEYVRVLAAPKFSKTAKLLRQNLAAKIVAATPDAVDESVVKRTLILTVRKDGPFNPVDRLEATRVKITLQDGEFANWDTAASQYTTVNAGTVQLTNTAGSQAGLAIGTPAVAPVAASLTGGVSQSSSRQETFPETFLIDNLTVAVEGDAADGKRRTLVIQRNGGPGVDLTGNVVVKLEIALDDAGTFKLYSADGLFSPEGKPLPRSKASITPRLHRVGRDRDLTADVSLEYVVRHVTTNGGTGVPRDQDVIEHTMTMPARKAVTVARRAEVFPASFGLYRKGSDERLSVRVPGMDPEVLCMEGSQGALDLLRYLRVAGGSGPIGGLSLGWSGLDSPFRVISSRELVNLEVRSGCYGPMTHAAAPDGAAASDPQ